MFTAMTSLTVQLMVRHHMDLYLLGGRSIFSLKSSNELHDQ